MYHNRADRITDIFNNLIRITEQDNCGELLQGLHMYKTYENYELVFDIRNEYNNPNIMLEAILATADKLLEWFDITEFCNFNILIRINEHYQKCIRMTYFELFQKVLTQGSGYDPYTFRPRNGMIVIHPRYERFMKWAGQERIREEYSKKRMEMEKERIEMMLGGGRSLFNQSDLVLPVSKPENKSWIRKVKEKILSL